MRRHDSRSTPGAVAASLSEGHVQVRVHDSAATTITVATRVGGVDGVEALRQRHDGRAVTEG